MSGPWSHDNHVTFRAALYVGGPVLLLTSATFASIVWHIMLMMIVCVPSLSALGITIIVANLLRGGTYRPGSRPFRLSGRAVRSLPRGDRRVVERPVVQGSLMAPPRRAELPRGKTRAG